MAPSLSLSNQQLISITRDIDEMKTFTEDQFVRFLSYPDLDVTYSMHELKQLLFFCVGEMKKLEKALNEAHTEIDQLDADRDSV